MTAYATSISAVSNGILRIQPATSQLLIARIEVNIGSTTTCSWTLTKNVGGSISGGTTNPATPMDDGVSSATTAVIKSGGTTSGGTDFAMHKESYVATAASPFFGNPTYSFPFDFIMSSTSILSIALSSTGPNVVTLYYDELHLARST